MRCAPGSRTSWRAFITGYGRALDTWTLAHRLWAMALVAALTLTTSVYLKSPQRAAELRAQRAAIEALEARVRTASALLAAPRRAGYAKRSPMPSSRTAPLDDATLLQVFSPVLDAMGLKLNAFEPGERTTTSHWHERRLQLRLSGSFSALIGFAARLETLPIRVIPATAQLRAQADRPLLLDISLRVVGMQTADHFSSSSQKAVQALDDARLDWPDPFAWTGRPSHIETDNSSAQLIGILQRGRMRAALVQSPAGVKLLRVGDLFEDATVQRIDKAALLLSAGAQAQRVLILHAPDAKRPTLPPQRREKKP